MIKTAGVIVIIAASITASIYNSCYYKNKLLLTEGMLDLVRYIRSRIVFFHDPLADIYSDFHNKQLEKTGFISILRQKGFADALSLSCISKCIDNRTYTKLLSFSDRLGKSGVDEQTANCDMCIEYLANDYEKQKNEMPQKTKMYSSLCIIAGLGAALLLI